MLSYLMYFAILAAIGFVFYYVRSNGALSSGSGKANVPSYLSGYVARVAGGDLGGLHEALRTLTSTDERIEAAVLCIEHASQETRAQIAGGVLPVPRWVRGAAYLDAAWEARGGGASSTVTEQGASLFDHFLRMAGEELTAASNEDPKDAAPLVLLIRTSMGKGEPPDRAFAFHEEAMRRDPGCFEAHYALIKRLGSRWSGDERLTFQFAEKFASEAPVGDARRILPLLAHEERWDYLWCFGADDEKESNRLAKAYVDRSDVRAACEAAFDESFGHPSYRPAPGHRLAWNRAAYFFYATGNDVRLRKALAFIGPDFTNSPWERESYPDAKKAFLRARAKVAQPTNSETLRRHSSAAVQ